MLIRQASRNAAKVYFGLYWDFPTLNISVLFLLDLCSQDNYFIHCVTVYSYLDLTPCF